MGEDTAVHGVGDLLVVACAEEDACAECEKEDVAARSVCNYDCRLPARAANDGEEFFGQGGSKGEDGDADYRVGQAQSVANGGNGVREDVAGDCESEEAEDQVDDVIGERFGTLVEEPRSWSGFAI